MSMVLTDHQAPSQEAVTTATARNLSGIAHLEPEGEQEVSKAITVSVAGAMTLATNTEAVALGMMAQT